VFRSLHDLSKDTRVFAHTYTVAASWVLSKAIIVDKYDTRVDFIDLFMGENADLWTPYNDDGEALDENDVDDNDGDYLYSDDGSKRSPLTGRALPKTWSQWQSIRMSPAQALHFYGTVS
jgi:hypothetical protein